MKSSLPLLTGFVCFVGILISSVYAGAEAGGSHFSPQWQAGLVWRVQVVYAIPVEQNAWSDTVSWEYRVSESENSNPEDSFIYIDAKGIDTLQPSARFTCRKSDCSLVSAEYTSIVRGQEKTRSFLFDGGHPVVTRQGPIPFDAPVFSIRSGINQIFNLTTNIDDFLKKQLSVEQTVALVPGGEPPLPEWTAGRQLLKVECRDKHTDSRLFVQYWDPVLPWPVYGENKNMKYWIQIK